MGWHRNDIYSIHTQNTNWDFNLKWVWMTVKWPWKILIGCCLLIQVILKSFCHSYVILSFLCHFVILMSFPHSYVIPSFLCHSIIPSSFCHYIIIPMSFQSFQCHSSHSYVILSFLGHSMPFLHHSISFLRHSMSFGHHSSRPPWPCHKVWRKVVHPEVRLG